jgi:hypothetical protein
MPPNGDPAMHHARRRIATLQIVHVGGWCRSPLPYHYMKNKGAWLAQELNMVPVHRVAAVASMLIGLGGCIVAAPPPPPAYGYGYGPGPGYYAPGYAPGYGVYPPPISLGFDFGFGGGRGHWR